MISSGGVLEEQVDQDYNLSSMSSNTALFEKPDRSSDRSFMPFIYVYSLKKNRLKQGENLWSGPLSLPRDDINNSLSSHEGHGCKKSSDWTPSRKKKHQEETSER